MVWYDYQCNTKELIYQIIKIWLVVFNHLEKYE